MSDGPHPRHSHQESRRDCASVKLHVPLLFPTSCITDDDDFFLFMIPWPALAGHDDRHGNRTQASQRKCLPAKGSPDTLSSSFSSCILGQRETHDMLHEESEYVTFSRSLVATTRACICISSHLCPSRADTGCCVCVMRVYVFSPLFPMMLTLVGK